MLQPEELFKNYGRLLEDFREALDNLPCTMLCKSSSFDHHYTHASTGDPIFCERCELSFKLNALRKEYHKNGRTDLSLGDAES
jgi:hypothetical protein